MAINDNQKVDFLWKKITFGVTETDITGKEGFNETIASPVPTYSKDIWAQAEQVPVPAPNASGAIVEYVTYQCTADPTVAGNVTWLATSTFGNIQTKEIDWVAPTFDPGYLVEVYDGDPSGGGNKLNQGTSGNEWVFDYIAGVLHFPNANAGASEIWIKAHRYIGEKGLTGGSVGSTVVSKQYADIATRDADTEVKNGQFAVVAAREDGEGAIYVATSDGPNGSWKLVSTDDSADLDAKSLEGDIVFGSGSETTLGNASQNTRVVNVSIEVTTPFDGTPSLTVGVDGTADALISDAMLDLSAVGTYEVSSRYTFTNILDTDIKAFYSAGGATAGEAKIIVTFA